jgi:hypothetical protein
MAAMATKTSEQHKSKNFFIEKGLMNNKYQDRKKYHFSPMRNE